MTDTTVKIFDSTMTGAPTLTNVAGNLLAVLDATGLMAEPDETNNLVVFGPLP